ncbi:hypothetical protein Tco_1471552 [Tanacetum coccineum]
MTKTKSFNKNTKHKALYHALMESILKDEDAIDKDVAEKSKKRKPDDADKDEGPPSTGTSKGTTKSQPKSIGKYAQADETVFEAGDTQVPQNQGDDMGNTDEPPVVNVDPKDLRNRKGLLLQILGPAYELLNGACRSYAELDYNMEECYKALNDQLDWNNPEDDRYPFDLSKPLPLIQSRNHHTKAAKYDLPGIEDMVPNLWSPIKVSYNKHALLDTSHWGPKRQRFYGYASKRVSRHETPPKEFLK